MKLYAVVEGIIASGKSVFVRQSVEHLRALGYTDPVAMYEPTEDNPFLTQFYQDMRRWAYTMQMHLLHCRFRMHLKAAVSDRTHILDRGLWGDVCFARLAHELGNMSDDEMTSYEQARDQMLDFMRPPNLLIFLDVPPAQAFERYKARSRSGEIVPLDYLKRLRDHYEEVITGLERHIPVYRTGWTHYSEEELPRQVAHVWSAALPKASYHWTRPCRL